MSAFPVVARFALLMTLLAAPFTAGAALTLAEAERLALEHAPWYQHHRTNVSATAERVEYEGQLPDPQLTTGFVNVPTDSYNLRQDDMTMTVVGVRQAFPPGDTRKLRTQRARQELTREEARLEVERRGMLRQVRATWYELYYAEQGLRLLEATRALARRDLESTEARYRSAQEVQRTVFRARQALARVEERLPVLRAAAGRARAQLGRWVGAAAREPLPETLPDVSDPPASFDPARHPEWRAAEAEVGAARADTDMARQDYKPGWMLDLQYGFRRPMPDGTERPDMVSAMVTFDLPIFRAKRQDRRLAERQARETAARLETEDKQRELVAMYEGLRAEYDALDQRVQVFEQQLLPNLRREAESTLAGFAREQGERREARMKQFDAELELLRLRVDRAKTRSELLYLTGDES